MIQWQLYTPCTNLLFPLVSLLDNFLNFDILQLIIIKLINQIIEIKLENTMTVEQLRQELMDIIKKDPVSLVKLTNDIGLKSPVTIIDFLRGKRNPYFKNLMLIGNWLEKQRKT